MKKLLLILLFSPLVSFAQDDLEQYDSALFFINMIREHQELKPLELDEKLNQLAKTRAQILAIDGNYNASDDETGELYFYTNGEPYDNDYYLDASIALILPDDDNFTYEQITSKIATKIGFGKAKASPMNEKKDAVYTMIVMDSLY